MIQVEGSEDDGGQLPVGLAHVLVIVHLVSNALFLLNLADYIRYVDLVLLIVSFQIRQHCQFQMRRLVLDCGSCIRRATTPRGQLRLVVLVCSTQEVGRQTCCQRLYHVTFSEELLSGERGH